MNTINKPLEKIYMHLSSGRKYFPFAPKADDVLIEDIAHHLATNSRWNGATVHPTNPHLISLSVAEHSVYVSLYVEHELGRPDLAMSALLHDAAEAYIGDLIRPLKYSSVFAKPFSEVEEINERVIFAKFDIPYPLPKEVKIADDAVCNAELQQVVKRSPDLEWPTTMTMDVEPAPYEILMMPPARAREFFLGRYYSLEKLAKQAA